MIDPKRQQLVTRLEGLYKAIAAYPKLQFRELPQELQAQIKAEPVIGPITSSGLERTDNLLVRLMWLIYYLSDPTFPAAYQQKPAAAPTKSSIKSTPNNLDFGPYDPRKASNATN